MIGSGKPSTDLSSKSALSARQRQVLRWLDENPSHRARWLVNGRAPRREGPAEWTHMEVSGENGSIVVAIADWDALRGLVLGCASPDKLYGVSPEGRAALTTEIEERGASGSTPQ